MGVGFTIRPYQPGDAQPLSEIIRENLLALCHDDESDAVIQRLAGGYTAGEIAAAATQCTLLVALRNNRQIGCGAYSAHQQEPGVRWIHAVFVQKRLHGLGVGRAVMNALEQAAAAEGAAAVELGASLGSVGFYQRLGYLATKQTPQSGVLRMRKQLK